MIQINLLPGKKAFQLPVIMGIDLNLFNVKLILVALLVHAIIVPWFKSSWEDEVTEGEENIVKLNKNLDTAVEEGKASKDIQEKVEVLNIQEKKLQGKLTVVKQIIKIKKNPIGILLYLAKNIPEEIWLTTLTLENDTVTLEGASSNYKSIGVFIESLQGAIFFGNTIKLEDSRTLTNQKEGERAEIFKISGNIMRYE